MVEEPDESIGYEGKLPLNEELEYFVEHLDKDITCADGKTA